MTPAELRVKADEAEAKGKDPQLSDYEQADYLISAARLRDQARRIELLDDRANEFDEVYPAVVAGTAIGVYGFNHAEQEDYGCRKNSHTLVTPHEDIDLGHVYEHSFTSQRLEEVLRERGLV